MVYVACIKHWSSHSSKKPNINRIGISLRTDLVSGYFALRSALFLFTLILMVQCEKKKVIQNSELGIEQPTPPPSVPAKANYYHDFSKNPSIFDLSDVAAEVLPAEWVNAIKVNGYQTLEVTRGNVTFTLKVIDK
jgi:hypothetical protein